MLIQEFTKLTNAVLGMHCMCTFTFSILLILRIPSTIQDMGTYSMPIILLPHCNHAHSTDTSREHTVHAPSLHSLVHLTGCPLHSILYRLSLQHYSQTLHKCHLLQHSSSLLRWSYQGERNGGIVLVACTCTVHISICVTVFTYLTRGRAVASGL